MMNIEVVGPGCPFCRKLYQRTQEAVAENGIDAEVKHVTDLKTYDEICTHDPGASG